MQTTKTVQHRSHWSKRASDRQENGIEDLNISKIVQGRSDWTKRVQDGEEKGTVPHNRNTTDSEEKGLYIQKLPRSFDVGPTSQKKHQTIQKGDRTFQNYQDCSIHGPQHKKRFRRFKKKGAGTDSKNGNVNV